MVPGEGTGGGSDDTRVLSPCGTGGATDGPPCVSSTSYFWECYLLTTVQEKVKDNPKFGQFERIFRDTDRRTGWKVR